MHEKIEKLIKIFFLVLILCIFLPGKVFADSTDFKTNYTVEYFLKRYDSKIEATADLAIKITNLKSDVYVRKYQLSFPKSFEISNLTVRDDWGPVLPKITEDTVTTKIELEFLNPNIGRGTANTFYLKYSQNNLFKINGSIWEVIIPTIENSPEYKITVNLPPDTEKKISLSKPKPDFVSNLPALPDRQAGGRQVVWNNPKTKTVYATFGESQFYDLTLNYRIVNPKVVPVFTDISLPPDTLYQKTYYKSLVPKPQKVFTDLDGNYMARYVLLPGESKKIKYLATVETRVTPFEEMIEKSRRDIEKQKSYLLKTNEKVWDSSEISGINHFEDAARVFDFVTGSLSYDFKRIDETPVRFGARGALSSPKRALCQEYSDLFVAVSRANKIMSRELEGFAFSQSEVFRPRSLKRDLLHAWAEYFDTKANYWLSVDPTWADTSGIDYFSSLDFNHIVFAVHGKSSDTPAPAGSYKQTNDENQVAVGVSQDRPESNIHFSVEKISFSPKINDKNTYDLSIKIKNDGNVAVYDTSLSIFADGLILMPLNNQTIESLIPMEEKEYKFQYRSRKKAQLDKSNLTILIGGKQYYNDSVSIYPYYFDLGLKIAILICIMMAIFSIVLLVRRHKWKN